MQIINRNETRFNLGAQQILKIPRTPRVTITCRAGEIWITEAGLREDVVRQRGSTYASRGKGNVIAYAFDPNGFDCVRILTAIARYVDVARTMGVRLSAMMEAPSSRIGARVRGETRVSGSMLPARRTAARCNGMRALQGRD